MKTKAKKTTAKRMGRPRKHTHHIKVWRSPITEQWYWSIRATNMNKVADCGEGYHNREDCVNALLHLIDGILQNRVSVEDEGLKKG